MGDRGLNAISPSAVVRSRTDAKMLLGLWCARRAFFPLLLLGIVVATVVIMLVQSVGVDQLNAELERVSAQGNLLATLLSPFAGIALAILWRLAVAGVAFAAAYPSARPHQLVRTADRSRISYSFRTWWDRLFLTRAYRAVRWTWAARVEATRIAPQAGRFADFAERILRWLGWALLVGWLAIVFFAG